MRLARCNLQLPLDPIISCSSGRIAQIYGSLEILEELITATRVAATDRRTEGAGTWVAAQVGFREEKKVDAATGSDGGGSFEGGEGFGRCIVGAGLRDRYREGGHDDSTVNSSK